MPKNLTRIFDYVKVKISRLRHWGAPVSDTRHRMGSAADKTIPTFKVGKRICHKDGCFNLRKKTRKFCKKHPPVTLNELFGDTYEYYISELLYCNNDSSLLKKIKKDSL